MVSETFPLMSPDVVMELLADAVVFEAAVAANTAAGRHRVPYAITDAIERTAHDANIVALVSHIIGIDERWVMWGSNIQTGTPNDAGRWHVDLESMHWPTITVAVGIEGCSPVNATRCIQGSHRLRCAPSVLSDQHSDAEALRTAKRLDERCGDVVTPTEFSVGRFYAFDAKSWHSGQVDASSGRVMLFLHYQRASDPRIPLMTDFAAKTWSTEPAPFIPGPNVDGDDRPVNTSVHRPSPARRSRARAMTGRVIKRMGAVARWVSALSGRSRP